MFLLVVVVLWLTLSVPTVDEIREAVGGAGWWSGIGFVVGYGILSFVPIPGGKSAFYVGCGTGNLVERLSRVFPDIIGVEPDPSTAAVAATRLSSSVSGRIEQRPFGHEEPDGYDLIVGVARETSRATQPLSHMQAPTAAESFEDIRRVARSVMPGIRMRRRLFWRYTATWTSPG